MNRYFAGISSAVLGLVLVYSAWGTQVRIARADDGGEAGIEMQAGAGAGAEGAGLQTGADVQLHSRGGEDMQPPESTTTGRGNDQMEQEDDNVIAATSSVSLEDSIRHQEDEMNQEASSTGDNHGREVRLAVHALLASKALLGGIGPEVSVIARNLDSSVSSTAEAEANIQSRGWLTRFFFGGDRENAQVILNQTAKNQQDITQLNNLIAGCTNCSPQVKTLLTDQLNVALAEQTRLTAMAKAEADARGIFGTVLGWFGK